MNKIVVGRLGSHPEGICYYGKKGQRGIFPFPINLGNHIIQEVSDEPIKLEIVHERKKCYIIGYDSRLGMIVKAELLSVHVMPVILETICRKFKVTTIVGKDNSTVDEDKLRAFLNRSRNKKMSMIHE